MPIIQKVPVFRVDLNFSGAPRLQGSQHIQQISPCESARSGSACRFGHSTRSTCSRGPADVIRRSEAWIQQREQKREALRAEQLASRFPFNPQIDKNKGARRVHSTLNGAPQRNGNECVGEEVMSPSKGHLSTLNKANSRSASIEKNGTRNGESVKRLRPSSAGSSDVATRSRSGGGNSISIAERSEAWLAYREQRRDNLREKYESDIGSFTPQLYKPERSAKWLDRVQGLGDLHERGLKAIAQRELRYQQNQEAKLAADVRLCPFTPDLSGSWPPPQMPTSPSEASPVCGSLAEKAGNKLRGQSCCPDSKEGSDCACCNQASVKSPTVGASNDRPSPNGRVTPERAAEFWERQVAWRQACLEEREKMLEEQRCRSEQGEVPSDNSSAVKVWLTSMVHDPSLRRCRSAPSSARSTENGASTESEALVQHLKSFRQQKPSFIIQSRSNRQHRPPSVTLSSPSTTPSQSRSRTPTPTPRQPETVQGAAQPPSSTDGRLNPDAPRRYRHVLASSSTGATSVQCNVDNHNQRDGPTSQIGAVTRIANRRDCRRSLSAPTTPRSHGTADRHATGLGLVETVDGSRSPISSRLYRGPPLDHTPDFRWPSRQEDASVDVRELHEPPSVPKAATVLSGGSCPDEVNEFLQVLTGVL